jgi:hypothetical protein
VIPLPNIPLPVPAFPATRQEAKKWGQKNLHFIYLPLSICLSLFVWPAIPFQFIFCLRLAALGLGVKSELHRYGLGEQAAHH